jgi:4-amino-4-deoxy-L-arabinose transferase-like glycosyltransferase
VAAWALALVWLAGVFAMVVSYDGNGGHLHPRYLFPGLAVLAVIGAAGLDRLAGGRRGLWVLGLAATQLALTAAAWAGFVTALRGRRPGGPAELAGGLAGLLAAAGVSRLLLAVAGMLVLGALGLLGLALARTGPRRPAPRPVPMTTLESSHAS